MGCHFFLQKVKVKVTQSRLTLCNPMDYTVHRILQVRILEWVTYPFSRGSSQPTQGLNPGLLHCRQILYQPQSSFSSVQLLSGVRLCHPMNRSTSGLPVHHQLQESTQTHVHRVNDAHPTISSSIIPFSSCPHSFPASGYFPLSQFFASGGRSIGTSASASVLPMNI